MEANVAGIAGLPRDGENILWDSRRNVVAYDFYGASASTNESTAHFFCMVLGLLQ